MTIHTALVTGANGFIGAALTRALLRRGVAVRAVCRTPHKGAALAQAGAEVVRGDVQDLARLTDLTNGCDVFFHVAAVMGSAAYTYNVNVLGAQNAIQAAHKGGAARFVHVSTVAVYGFNVTGSVAEDHPQQPSPNDYYSITKMHGERHVWAYAARTGLPTTVIRPAFVYGEGSTFWSQALYALCRRFPVPLVDGGRGHAHPIYVEDVCDLLIHAAEHPQAVGNAFNAAPDPAPTWAEFLGYYARMAGRTISFELPLPLLNAAAPLITVLTRLRGTPFDVAGFLRVWGHRATYSMARAADLLGWQPSTSLAEGMRRTELWLRRNRLLESSELTNMAIK